MENFGIGSLFRKMNHTMGYAPHKNFVLPQAVPVPSSHCTVVLPSSYTDFKPLGHSTVCQRISSFVASLLQTLQAPFWLVDSGDLPASVDRRRGTDSRQWLSISGCSAWPYCVGRTQKRRPYPSHRCTRRSRSCCTPFDAWADPTAGSSPSSCLRCGQTSRRRAPG